MIAHDRRAPVLNAAMEHLDLEPTALWVAYVGLAGNAAPGLVHGWLGGSQPIPDHDYDTLAQALNEAFTERGEDSPVPYADE